MACSSILFYGWKEGHTSGKGFYKNRQKAFFRHFGAVEEKRKEKAKRLGRLAGIPEKGSMAWPGTADLLPPSSSLNNIYLWQLFISYLSKGQQNYHLYLKSMAHS